MGAFIDITGQQFGNWIAIKYDIKHKNKGLLNTDMVT